jgi:hypothetical protein
LAALDRARGTVIEPPQRVAVRHECSMVAGTLHGDSPRSAVANEMRRAVGGWEEIT